MAVERNGITAFPIYFDTYEEAKKRMKLPGGIFIPPPAALRKEDYDLGRFYLADLVRLSGGRPVVAPTLSSGNIAFFDTIPEQLRSRYIVKFRIPQSPSGVRLPLQLRINRPALTMQVRGSILN